MGSDIQTFESESQINICICFFSQGICPHIQTFQHLYGHGHCKSNGYGHGTMAKAMATAMAMGHGHGTMAKAMATAMAMAIPNQQKRDQAKKV